MRLVSFVTAIVIGFGCSANAGEQPPSELLAACDQAAAAASRLQAVVECPLLCRFSAAGMTVSPRTPMAGGRKPPRHEIAGSWAPARQRALCGFNVGAALDGKRDASATSCLHTGEPKMSAVGISAGAWTRAAVIAPIESLLDPVVTTGCTSGFGQPRRKEPPGAIARLR